MAKIKTIQFGYNANNQEAPHLKIEIPGALVHIQRHGDGFRVEVAADGDRYAGDPATWARVLDCGDRGAVVDLKRSPAAMEPCRNVTPVETLHALAALVAEVTVNGGISGNPFTNQAVKDALYALDSAAHGKGDNYNALERWKAMYPIPERFTPDCAPIGFSPTLHKMSRSARYYGKVYNFNGEAWEVESQA